MNSSDALSLLTRLARMADYIEQAPTHADAIFRAGLLANAARQAADDVDSDLAGMFRESFADVHLVTVSGFDEVTA